MNGGRARPIIAWVTIALCIGAVCAQVAVMLSLVDSISMVAIVLTAYAIAPYVGCGVAAMLFAPHRFGSWVILVTALGSAAFAAWAMISAFILHPDAQSAIVLVVMPWYQWPAIAVAFTIACACTRQRIDLSLPHLWRNLRGGHPEGYCEHCGFDLRGSPPGGGCPECGRSH